MPSSPSRRRTDDRVVVGLNACGLSLAGIGRRLGIHHTTVAARLKGLGIPPADTRRAFMEEVFDALTLEQQVWLIGRIGAGTSVKELVRSLLIDAYVDNKTPSGKSIDIMGQTPKGIAP